MDLIMTPDLEKEFKEKSILAITHLQLQIEKLESENKSLKQMLESNLPILDLKSGTLGISNEQLICEAQIALLKEKAMKGELNADETRRFAIYADVLERIKKSDKNPTDIKIEKMSDEELLKLAIVNESK